MLVFAHSSLSFRGRENALNFTAWLSPTHPYHLMFEDACPNFAQGDCSQFWKRQGHSAIILAMHSGSNQRSFGERILFKKKKIGGGGVVPHRSCPFIQPLGLKKIVANLHVIYKYFRDKMSKINLFITLYQIFKLLTAVLIGQRCIGWSVLRWYCTPGPYF